MIARAPSDLVNQIVRDVKDPEIPTVSIGELGIVRGVEISGRRVKVTITPTYSGCPALDTIRSDIKSTLEEHGFEVEIRTVLAPAWTTDMISPEGLRHLAETGIAPPRPYGQTMCPRCRAAAPKVVSEFGSNACKALMVCSSCREPFDLFKVHA